jgi:hypothetical protein
LPRLATRRSRRWSQIFKYAAFSASRDHAVKDEKRGMKSNDHAAMSAIRDQAVEDEYRAAFRALRDLIRDQAVKIPKPDRTETRQEEAGSSCGWGACSDLYGSMAKETEKPGPNSQVLSLTHTSADLVGSMANVSERERSTAQGAGRMGPAHGQAPPEASQGVQRSQSSQVLSLTHTSEEKKDTESNNVATLNVGRDHAVKEEKKMIESNNVAALNGGRDHAVKEEKKMIAETLQSRRRRR